MKQGAWVVLLVALAVSGCSRANLVAIGPAPKTDAGGSDRADSGGGDRPDSSGNDLVDSAADVSDSGVDVFDVGVDSADSGADTADGGRDVADSGSDVADSGPADGAGTSVVCPSQILKPGDTVQNLMMGTTARSYVLHVPNRYDGTKAVPLILDFHAQAGTGANERSISPYPPQTDPEGVIMAFPTGQSGPLGSSWDVGPCCVEDVDDVGFAKKVVTHVQSLACIDPKRIYAVGLGPGGGLAYLLACEAADVFASVAPAAWDLLKETVADCTPSRPITVIAFRGTADNLIPYEGGYSTLVGSMPITFLGAQATFKQWAQIDACTGPPSDPDINGCSSYSNCASGAVVTLCSKQTGGFEAGNPSIAWPLLKQHPKP